MRKNQRKEKYILVTGNSNVGKTALLNRYKDGTFEEDYNPTEEHVYMTKRVPFLNKTLTLHLIDTAGQSRGRHITTTNFHFTHAIVFVYDVTDQESFTDLQEWLEEAAIHSPDICRVIVGNKSDLAAERVVDTDIAKEFARNEGAEFIEISAKTGENVDCLFDIILPQLETAEPPKLRRRMRRSGACIVL